MNPINDLPYQHLAELFSALGDANRLRILFCLLDGEQSVGALCQQLELNESNVSHQLRSLRLQHIVRARKQGRSVFYSLDDAHVSDLLHQSLEHLAHL